MNTPSGDGFVKIARPDVPSLTGSQKSVLNRKGNELFNAGRIAEAKKIFLTTGYTDGLSRLGDYYLARNQAIEAFKMYCLAPDTRKKEMMIGKFASVIRSWIRNSTHQAYRSKKEVENNG